MTPLSMAVILLVGSTSFTGLMVGYDLCIVNTVRDAIEADYNLCTESSFNTATTTPSTNVKSSFYPEPECSAFGLFISIAAPGAALGSLSAGAFSDIFGRKKCLMLADILILCGSFFFFFARSYAALLVGRFVMGSGVGVGFVVFSTYIPEVAPEDRRGQLVALQDCALSTGCLLSFAISAIVPDKGWPYLLGGVGILAAVQFISCFFLLESPRWLVRKNRSDEAIQVLLRLMPSPSRLEAKNGLLKVSYTGADQADPTHSSTEMTLDYINTKRLERCNDMVEAMQMELKEEESHRIEWKRKCRQERLEKKQKLIINKSISKPEDTTEVIIESSLPIGSSPPTENDSDSQVILNQSMPPFSQNKEGSYLSSESTVTFTTWCRENQLMHSLSLCSQYRKPIFIAVGCAVAQNFMFGPTVLYFSTRLMKTAGITNKSLAGVAVGLVKLLGVISAIFSVEQLGRRPLLLWGSVTTFLCHILFAIFFGLREVYVNSGFEWGILVVMLIFIFAWNISWAGLMFVVAGEVLPSCVRGSGIGLTITVFWTLCFIFQTTYATIINHLKLTGAFSFFASLNFLSVLFVVFFVPDLSGVVLEDVGKALLKKKPTI